MVKSEGRFPRTLHATVMTAGADILYLYMTTCPKQEWLHKLFRRCKQCCELRPSHVMKRRNILHFIPHV